MSDYGILIFMTALLLLASRPLWPKKRREFEPPHEIELLNGRFRNDD